MTAREISFFGFHDLITLRAGWVLFCAGLGRQKRKGCQFGAGTLGGGEGFLKGLLLGEWVGGTVHL